MARVVRDPWVRAGVVVVFAAWAAVSAFPEWPALSLLVTACVGWLLERVHFKGGV